jgi:hypothetical protein
MGYAASCRRINTGAVSMSNQTPLSGAEKLAAAQHHLELVLGFFERVDSKMSVVLGVDLAMSGLLFTEFHSAQKVPPYGWLFIVVFSILIAASLLSLYRGSFPNLNGGHTSLVYFRELQKKPESDFLTAYRNLKGDSLADDYLGQVWRNAKILSLKFDRLKDAYVFMAWAIAPWAAALVTFNNIGAK